MKDYLVSDLIIESSFYNDPKYISDLTEENVNGMTVKRCLSGGTRTFGGRDACRGAYVTVELPATPAALGEQTDSAVAVLSSEIQSLIKRSYGKPVDSKLSVMIVGIGNRHITPDAIGPMVVERLSVTRHVALLDKGTFDKINVCKVCAISCGVMGETGIETAELIKGVLSQVHADVVIAIDALAARDMGRLARVIQLCDAGISPGAGVGNRRSVLNKETLGVPIIAIGVPTVISAATLVADVLTGSACEPKEARALSDKFKGLFVTPKDCDAISEIVSSVIARSLDRVFCGI